jgi:glycosyltransferase involved in cell wall biosynthesis
MGDGNRATRLFFSIVVPTHNEEHYIGRTLDALAALDYPKDRYEVLVIENASTDRTLEKAMAYEDSHIRIFSYDQKGVSFARNRGAERARPDGDWVIFLDADTLLAPPFLRELNAFLTARDMSAYAAGVFRILPLSSKLFTRLLYPLGNGIRFVTHTIPYTTFAIRRDVLEVVKSDERRQVAEDLAFVNAAREYGKSFYMPTDTIATSTRRFDAVGWLHMIFYWALIMSLPASLQRTFIYRVIR